MFKSIQNFVQSTSINNLLDYDFKNEAPYESVRSAKNPIEKFNLYKLENKKGELKFDCDSNNGTCSLSEGIYSILWGWSYKNRYQVPEILNKSLGSTWVRFGPDTLNSFATTYKIAIKLLGEERAQNNEQLELFATMTHNVRNFSLMPFKLKSEDEKSFNQFRGANFGSYFVYDYFDLSLKIISETIDTQTFRNFIDIFLLNDFVNSDYNVIPLIQSHKKFLESDAIDVTNPAKFLPQNESELNEYLANVNLMIKARSQRVIDALSKKMDLPAIPQQVDNNEAISNETIESKKKPANKSVKTNEGGSGHLSKFLNSKNINILKRFSFIVVVTMLVLWGIEIYDTIHNSSVSVESIIQEYGLLAMVLDLFRSTFDFWNLLELSFWFTLILFVSYFYIKSKLWTCKRCGKIFAIKKISKKQTGRKQISIKKVVKERDRDGVVVRTKEQYIPGERIFYDTNFQCKFCGHIIVKSSSEDIAHL